MRLIDADMLMKEFAEFVKSSNNSDFARVPTWNDAVSLLESAPTIEPEPKPIEYQDCANALLEMWMDNVLTDGEYSKIITKLNTHLIEMAYEEGEQE